MVAPLLRFTEFTDDWEETTLENLAEVERGKFSVRPRNDPRYFDGEMPFVQTGDVAGSDMYLKGYSQTLNADGIKVSKVFPADTILITIAANIGDTTITRYAVACPDSVVAIQSKKDKANTIFLKNLIDLQKEVLDSQATQNAQKNINLQVLKPLELFAPSIEEQTKIASFLSNVDEKISQLTQKHALLSQYKQGMMQKLFSQQLRFKADDGSEFGEWEEKIIGEIANIKRGASPRPITDTKWFDEDSKVGWVRISDVSKSKKVLVETEQYLSIAGIKKSRFIPKGNIIMSICATIGKPIYTGFDVCIHDGFVVFSELKAWYEYTYYYLEWIEKNWYQYGQSGTQVNLNSDIVSNEIFPFPCLEEQTKIANFLSAIDQKIEVVAQQIEQAKTWKKGLLQQMFV